jgi:hypothetical protein
MNPAFCLLLAVVSPQAPVQSDLSVAQVRQNAAKAVGTMPSAGYLEMKGVAEFESLWQNCEMVADSQFRYKTTVSGLLPEVEAFDGKTLWVEDKAGTPHIAVRSDRDLSRIVAYVVDGAWTSPAAPLTFRRLPSDSPGTIELEVRCTGGQTPATLELDSKTYLPSQLSYWGTDGTDVWTFSSYRNVSGLRVPTHVDHRGGDQNERIVLDTIRLHDSGSASFGAPKVDDDGATYDRAAPKEIEMKRVMGLILVHPKLDGQDDGWFFFDSGADCMVLDNQVAERHGFAAIGSELTAGIVATSNMKICQADNFQLGPVTLKRPVFYEMDMSGMSAALGVKVAGVCGYDYISRASFDIDCKAGKFLVYEPGKVPLPHDANWIGFDFKGNVPCLSCKFAPDREGDFKLDTGSMSAVDFCSPTVERFGMLKDGNATSFVTGGAGGSAESKLGTIGWFELAGRRYVNFNVGLQITKKGEFASPFFEGNIGIALISNRRFLFDYRRSRVAFVTPPKPAAPRSGS